MREQATRALEEVHELLRPIRERVAEHADLFRERHALAAAEERALASDDLASLAARFRSALQGLGPIVDGMGVVAARGVLVDAPMFLEWWRQGVDGSFERLSVSLEPDDPAYYVYDEADWFRAPADSGRLWITGPMVDHGGTNAHICTLQQPVFADDAGATFLGLAGADLRFGQIEHAARRVLTAVDVSAALVNNHGRVIAANTPHITPGSLIGEPLASSIAKTTTTWQSHGDAQALRDTDLPWAIVLFDPD